MKNLLVVFFVMITATLAAQNQLSLSGTSKIVVKGSSSLSDWEMKSDSAKGMLVAKVNKGKLQNAEELEIAVPSESLKSGRSGMDDNAYKSLKTSTHKEIKFYSDDIKVSKEAIVANGKLTIAGTTKPIVVNGKCLVGEDGSVNCKGSQKLKMTEFDVEPPTAMFGSITTGDEIEIVFEVSFK